MLYLIILKFDKVVPYYERSPRNFHFHLNAHWRTSLQSMNGCQIYQILTTCLFMCLVQCCRHFTNLI